MYLPDLKYFFLQLIPVSVIAYRSQYGSSNPSAITGAAIAATLVSTATAVIFCKIKEKMTKDTFDSVIL